MFYKLALESLQKHSSRCRRSILSRYAEQIPPLCQKLSCLAKEVAEVLDTEPTQLPVWYHPPQLTIKGKPRGLGKPALSADTYNDLSLLAQYGVTEMLYFLSTRLEDLLECERFQDMLNLLVCPALTNKMQIETATTHSLSVPCNRVSGAWTGLLKGLYVFSRVHQSPRLGHRFDR